MRCLYCGKELALLKRWTGGGEFCSDTHRQQYQEEYNQLALNRLLQAKPQEASKATAKAAPPPVAAPVVVQEPAPDPAPTLAPAPKLTPKPAPQPNLVMAEARAPEPVPEPEPVDEAQPEAVAEEESAPADQAGFLIEMPVPVGAEVRAMAAGQDAEDRPFPPELPSRVVASSASDLVLAGHVPLQPSGQAMDCTSRPAERRLEVREFVRSSPVVDFDAPSMLKAVGLNAAGETGLTEISEESMDILFFPYPARSAPVMWQHDVQPFIFGYELGALARVAFRTTGLEDKSEGLELMPVERTDEQLAGAAPVEFAKREAPASPAAPEAISKTQGTPVVSVRVAQPPVPKTPAPRPAAAASASPSEKKPEPEVITRPLPLTLHGLAAGRGKPVQVFPAGVAGNLEIQAPRSNALPLRPVMTLGPAPAPSSSQAPVQAPLQTKPSVKMEVKPEPKKSSGQPTRSDARFSNGKGRKPEVEKSEPEPKAAEPVAAAVSEAKQVEAKTPKIEPKPAESRPAEPAGRIYTPADLGLPKLTIESNGVVTPMRIGIAAAAVLVVALIAYFALRGGGSTVVAKGPQVVAGSPLPALDSGWITDWGAEPGVRREHEISVLRPSVNLADYRIEFQAQIENKALGWVFRAKDGKNYYVGKLEIVTPGLEPTVAAVHFAVIDGQAQARAQTPLPMKVRLDTLYKVRFEALGDHFTTWVQDQKVDDWTDGRLKMGGAGLYNERGERMSLDGGVNVVPLVIKR